MRLCSARGLIPMRHKLATESSDARRLEAID
jgi:hypothetical protein